MFYFEYIRCDDSIISHPYIFSSSFHNHQKNDQNDEIFVHLCSHFCCRFSWQNEIYRLWYVKNLCQLKFIPFIDIISFHYNFFVLGHNEVKSLDVSGCEGDYCVLHKGKTINLDMVCKSNQDSEHLKLVISADVNGIEIEVPGFDQDGCHYIQCPVHKGQQYDVKYSYTIPSVLPNIKANLTAKVTGDQGLLGCLKLQGEIAD